jgi:glycosyltransferase involved in cell wall biosynthesis
MGHEVDCYSETNYLVDTLNPIDIACRTVWSVAAYQNVMKMLAGQTHNVVHVQNFFPVISPSVYYAARVKRIPVVQTLRNYRLLCPNALFFRNGRICEDCMGKPVPWPGIVNACYRGSRLKTGVVVTMLTVHRAIDTWAEMVDVYIALTQFARQKFIEGGIPSNKIVVKPNFVYPDPGQAVEKDKFALYVGRLSPEKGVDTLIETWRSLGSEIPLKILGEGPLQSKVIAATQKFPWIEWLGPKPLSDVYNLMGQAKVLIFPSCWYETFGRVIVEAFAKGTPVIASNIGAIPELVEHGRTGLLFQAGNRDDLAQQIDRALTNPTELAEMGRAARSEFEAKYTAEDNYKQLMEIYKLAQS